LSGKKLPRMRVISCVNPAITAKPYPTVSIRTRRELAGNAVGSPLPLRRYGPVTTDPFGERLQSCHSLDVASRRGKSTAGATRGLSANWEVDVSIGRTNEPGGKPGRGPTRIIDSLAEMKA
jgi:hypothetical protein